MYRSYRIDGQRLDVTWYGMASVCGQKLIVVDLVS